MAIVHAVIIISAVSIWEILAHFSFVSPLIISSLEQIISFGEKNYNVVLANLPDTLTEIGVSVAITIPLGIILGVVIGYYYVLDSVFTPLLTALFAVPSFIFYPLFIVWFGLGIWSKVALALSVAFFPLTLNTITGVRTIDRTYIRFARSLGLSSFATMRRIVLPLASPAILDSIKISLAFIIVGVIVSELLGGFGGLGVLIAQFQSEIYVPGVYFVVLFVFLIVIIAILVSTYFEYVAKKRVIA